MLGEVGSFWKEADDDDNDDDNKNCIAHKHTPMSHLMSEFEESISDDSCCLLHVANNELDTTTPARIPS